MSDPRTYRDDVLCPYCGSNWMRKAGTRSGRQAYQCGDCNRRHTPDTGTRKVQLSKPQDRATAVKMYREGSSLREIGRALGFSYETVRLWMQSEMPQDSYRHKIAVSPRVKARTVEMYLEGYNLTQIAGKVGYSVTAVGNWIKKQYPEVTFRRKASPQTREQAVEMFISGIKLTHIARELGFDHGSVRRWLEDELPDAAFRQASPSLKALAVTMHAQGMSQATIGRKLGYHIASVNRWIRDANS